MKKELLSPEFSKHLNTTFSAQVDDKSVLTFELIKVDNKPPPHGYECFSLVFRASDNTPIKQRTYRLEHEHMDASDIFLVPIDKDEKGILFEAVFNRRIE